MEHLNYTSNRLNFREKWEGEKKTISRQNILLSMQSVIEKSKARIVTKISYINLQNIYCHTKEHINQKSHAVTKNARKIINHHIAPPSYKWSSLIILKPMSMAAVSPYQ